MRNRLVILLICLLPSCVWANELDSLRQLMVFDWNIEAVTDSKGQAIHTNQMGDKLSLKEDGSFTFNIDKEKINKEGNWLLEGEDTLILLWEYLAVPRTEIDSMTYEIADNKPILVLYKGNQEIARYANDLGSPRRVETYKIAHGKRGQASLVSANKSMKIFKEHILKPTSFSFVDILRGMLGMCFLIFIAWLCSVNRAAINWRLVGVGLLLQIIFGLLVLKVPFVQVGFDYAAKFFVAILAFTQTGADFVFGPLAKASSIGFIFAFQILPTIVFFSALTSLLYYLGILQRVVYGFAWVMSYLMKLSGAESLSAAGNIFLGQTESPLLVKPYLDKMTKSEIMCLMTGGMATMAGGVLAAYLGFIGNGDPELQKAFAMHLLTASIMSAPAAIVAAKILFPETEEVNRNLSIPKDKIGSNVLDAIAKGSTDGLKLAVNVAVMLVVFYALIEMVSYILANGIGAPTGLNEMIAEATGGRYNQLNLSFLFGIICAPLAWLLGTHPDDMLIVGQLLGEKTVLNEFIAYMSLGNAQTNGIIIHEKSLIIATYALCGFSNFASIGIQIGGIGAIAPTQRETLSALGIRALIGGTIACLLTATIAGMLVSM